MISTGGGRPVSFTSILLFHRKSIGPIFRTLPSHSNAFHVTSIGSKGCGLLIHLINCSLCGHPNVILSTISGTMSLKAVTVGPLRIKLTRIRIMTRGGRIVCGLSGGMVRTSSGLLTKNKSTISVLRGAPSVHISTRNRIDFHKDANFAICMSNGPDIFDNARTLRRVPTKRVRGVRVVAAPSTHRSAKKSMKVVGVMAGGRTRRNFDNVIGLAKDAILSHKISFLISRRGGTSH